MRNSKFSSSYLPRSSKRRRAQEDGQVCPCRRTGGARFRGLPSIRLRLHLSQPHSHHNRYSAAEPFPTSTGYSPAQPYPYTGISHPDFQRAGNVPISFSSDQLYPATTAHPSPSPTATPVYPTPLPPLRAHRFYSCPASTCHRLEVGYYDDKCLDARTSCWMPQHTTGRGRPGSSASSSTTALSGVAMPLSC
ncbi:hypothetical protein ZWY2020_009329 [Hordeum vulgare]|nr:hypothetical protein ZWY2020_009329 [Hordeum vulgare]